MSSLTIFLCLSLAVCSFAQPFHDNDKELVMDPNVPPLYPNIPMKPFAAATECDIVADNGVCLFGGEKVILPDAQPKDLVGHWSFDDSKGLDSSGSRNHARNVIPPGPAQGGFGASAMFNGFDWVEVPHSTDFTSKTFSLTFWLYLVRDINAETRNAKGLRWCPIVHKGIDDHDRKVYERTPALFFDRRDRNLKLYVSSTENEDFPQGEYALSNARIPYQRWTHIGIVRLEKRLRLYVNGILDVSNRTEGWTVANDAPLYIGNTPWHKEDCNVPSYIDEVRYYKRALSRDEVQAEAGFALGGVEPNFVKLGCAGCSLEDAARACNDGYHLCSTIELHTAGYQVGRAMGWLDANTKVWSHGAIPGDSGSHNSTEGGEASLGLGLCCSDLN